MRRKRAREHDADLSPQERERRRIQRDRQKHAYAVRQQGHHYSKAVKGSESRAILETKSMDKASRSHIGAGPASSPVQEQVQVTIIAIFWNQRRAEKTLVLGKCEEVREKLESRNLSVIVDCNSKFTPGQRMRYWEEKGVKVRIELGPKDAEQNTCIVARSQNVPGQVAFKKTSEIGVEMFEAVTEMLQMPAEEVPAGVIEKHPSGKRVVTSQKSTCVTTKKGVPRLNARLAKGGDNDEDDFIDI